MAWKVTEVAQIEIPTGHIMPGVNLQQDGHSPTVTFVFESGAKARTSHDAMNEILDNCAAIVHLGPR